MNQYSANGNFIRNNKRIIEHMENGNDQNKNNIHPSIENLIKVADGLINDNKLHLKEINTNDQPLTITAKDKITLKTTNFCIGDTCITENELKNIKNGTFKSIRILGENDKPIEIKNNNDTDGQHIQFYLKDGTNFNLRTKNNNNSNAYIEIQENNTKTFNSNNVLVKGRSYNHKLGESIFAGVNHLDWPLKNGGVSSEKRFTFSD
jgi:hypothetical protein